MRREWTVAGMLVAAVLAGGSVANAGQERPAPAQEVERERVPAQAPAALPPAPSPSAGWGTGTTAEPRSPSEWRTSSFSEDASGQARPRTGGSSSASSGSRGRSGGSSASAPRGGSDSQGRVRSPGSVSGGSSGGSGRTGASSDSPADSSSAARQRYPTRNRDGSLSTGYAVRRGSVRPPYGGGGWYYPSHPWYGSWYPYGFGSWGLGFYMWDPYWYGGWGSPYGYGYGYAAAYYDTGAVRTLVKPRDAQVFVDGYYVGIVDEFDGQFQRLRLDTGPHRIEIRKEGFETLRFDVRVTFDHTITLRGELKPAEPTP